ncbi:AAA family ATPase [Glycomyces tritici]|uniref:Uncharacterized AAA domain-containing protein ycf46 n=1 Tax=Glycomyces tritici TaxID=2665176 RepID=A0ABT7YUX3_9ACTN|nr:AAA family ATPase [Glycomyces tritici]MDN3242436.1 AAA family ATPase [Glycomyces tritici]
MPNAAATREQLESYLRARIPFVSIRTSERARAREILRKAAQDTQLDVLVHTLSQGLRDITTGAVVTEDVSVHGAIDYIGRQFEAREHLTVVFTDIQQIGDDNDMSRRLVDLATLAESRSGCVIVITNDPIWTPLQRLGMSVTLDVPDLDEMKAEIQKFVAPYREHVEIEWDDEAFGRAASILTGITRTEALNIMATLLARLKIGNDDLDRLSLAKDSIFADLNGIERVRLSGGDHRLGGLEGLRAWLDRKQPLLTMDLRDRDLRPPRGVLLIGVPGCGKSLSAKFVAARWRLPLYRLDLAAIFGQYVGQSESRLKEALQTADTVAPCVLWIDEIEKGLAGSGSDSTGITTRLVGQFLYWLQESAARVFVVATANDVRSLPQELLRSGRFDDLFFVDLPMPEERREIIEIYLEKYLKVPVASEVVDDLVSLSEGFAGSDIQAAVAEIGHEAIREGDANVEDDFFRRAFKNVFPLSKTAPERIQEVRQLSDRAIPASGRFEDGPAQGPTGGRRVVLS